MHKELLLKPLWALGGVAAVSGALCAAAGCRDQCSRENEAWCENNIAHICSAGGGGGHGPGRNYLDKENCSKGGSLDAEVPLTCMDSPLFNDAVACGFPQHECTMKGRVCVGSWVARCLGYEHPVPVERCQEGCEQLAPDVARCMVRCSDDLDRPRCSGPNETVRCVDGGWRREATPCVSEGGPSLR